MRPATFWFSVLFQTFEYDCVDLSLFFFFICSTFGQNSLIRKEERGRGRCSHFLRVPSCRFGMWLQSVISFRVSLFLFVYYWYYLMFWLYDVSTDGRHKSFFFLNFFCYCFLLTFIWFSAWTRKRCPSPALCVATLTFCWICLILQLKENWLTCRVGGLRLRFVVCLLSVGPKERQTNFLLWKGRS